MKILLVEDTDWINKGTYQQNHLMDRLSVRSHDIRVIDHEIGWKAQKKHGLRSRKQVIHNVSRTIEGAKITVIRPGILRIPNLDYISLLVSRKREIDRQIKEFRPDIIIGFHILSAYLGMRAARKNDIPFIYYWVDVYHTQIPFKPFQFIGRKLEKSTIKGSDKVIVINEKLKDFVNNMAPDTNEIPVIRGTVDLDSYNPSIDSDMLKKDLGINVNDTVLFYMGSTQHYTGLKEVALELSKVNNPNLKLVIVGDGDIFEDLKEIRDKYGLHERLILTGRRPYDEMPSLIGTSDICLLPFHEVDITRSIVPIKTYEYMAMKKPVLATKLPGVIKEFGEGNGVIYVDNPEDVIKKAIELVSSDNITNLGLKARKFVEKYGWENITDEFEKVIIETIKE